MTQTTVTTDVLIIGAGIAGLWLHNRLNKLGFHSLLLENKTIGNAQTLSSQGIIHGGAKYALNGILSKATQAIGDMPKRWHDCLSGQGDVDLTQATVFTDHQLMWSKDQLSSKMLSFFASKALASRMQAIPDKQKPSIFNDAGFKGSLYQLDEPVLDIPSVLKCLAEPYHNRIVHYQQDSDLSWQTEDKQLKAVQLSNGTTIQAQHLVLTAGEGTGELLQSLNIKKPAMQLRPLQMVLCKAKDPEQSLPTLYAHSLGSGSKPIATITSHKDKVGNTVWYIGGNIAENGVSKSLTQLSKEAERLLAEIMPWYSLPELQWAAHAVNRAEPKQSNLTRPDTAFVSSKQNVHIAWPTKLALAPDLADKVIEKLTSKNLKAGQHADNIPLPKAEFGQPLWDSAFS